MRRIIIKNIGPLQSVDIELARVNVIIGPQSSGKSCVLKIACYCTWVEKKIELAQSANEFENEDYFINELTRFHKLNGYFRKDSYISYESDYMIFSYDAQTKKFSFNWKDGRWEYRRPKVSYIPAERNMVAAIPNWFDVKLYDDNIQSFMADWDRARRNYTEHLGILNLGISYKYDAQANKDRVEVDDNTTLELTNTSSGLQSLIPLYVHLNYIGNDIYHLQEAQSFTNIRLTEQFLKTLYDELFRKTGKTESKSGSVTINEDGKRQISASITLAHIGPYLLAFGNEEYAEECRLIYERYAKTASCEVFLEEPENNLFPPTQSRLVDWLLNLTEGEHANSFFIATHSPYVLGELLRKKTPMGLFFIYEKDGSTIVKTATDEDMQNIYDYGVDAFFNIENLAE